MRDRSYAAVGVEVETAGEPGKIGFAVSQSLARHTQIAVGV